MAEADQLVLENVMLASHPATPQPGLEPLLLKLKLKAAGNRCSPMENDLLIADLSTGIAFVDRKRSVLRLLRGSRLQ